MKRVVVVGGGISGTAAAWTASRDAEVVLLEREADVGGKALTVRDGEWIFEAGPLGYLNNEPVVDELAEQAGLKSEALRAGAAQKRRFVFLDGRVREVRPSPLHLLASGVLSPRALLRAAREPWIPRKADDGDESVWDFAARRLGSDFAERLIHPMALGIFAGDAKRLSLASSFPLMAELERDHGSLVRAQIARARARRRGELPPRRGELCSFRDGLQSLPRALAERGKFETRTGASVTTIVPGRDHAWHVIVDGDAEPIPADAVIVATEGWRAASVLGDVAPEACAHLRDIVYPPVWVVAFGFGEDARASIPEGFGVLIPRYSGYRSLGVTTDGYLFPRGGLLVRVLLGGRFDPDIASMDASDVIDIAENEVNRLYHLSVSPHYRRARLWRRAIPQYELGHGELVRVVEGALSRCPGIFLAGNALHGPAFGKAAARGVRSGREALAFVSTVPSEDATRSRTRAS